MRYPYYDEPASYPFEYYSGSDYFFLALKVLFWGLFCRYIFNILLKNAKLAQRVISSEIKWIETSSVNSGIFYSMINTNLQQFNVPDITYEKRSLNEGIFLSDRREYSIVRYRGFMHVFSIAPFGTGYTISYRRLRPLSTLENMIGSIPFLGNILINIFFSETFYQADTHAAFNAHIAHAFHEAINSITTEESVRTFEGHFDYKDIRHLLK